MRSFGEILDGGFELLTERFALLVGIAALLYLPPSILGLIWLPASSLAPIPVADAIPAIGGHTAISLTYVLAAWPLVSTAVIHAANECCSGRRVTVLAALRVGWSIYLPVVGTSVLYGSIVLLGLILVVPGIIAALGFLVIGQVMVVERSFGAEAMRRSRALMRGHRLRGLALVVVSGSLVLFLQSGVLLALATVPYLGYPLSALAQAIGLAYSIAVTVLFYFDVRCRSESYDLQLLAAAVQVRGASA